MTRPIGRCLWMPLLAAVMILVGMSGTASASTSQSNVAINVWGGTQHEPGHRLTPRAAIATLRADPHIARALVGHPAAIAGAFALPGREWEVIWLARCSTRCLRTARITDSNDVLVNATLDDASGRVEKVWTGIQAKTAMARGGATYLGGWLGKPYVFLAFCVLFLAPFIDPRRPLRLLHFDLLALLGFAASEVFFARGDLGVSAPLVYPVLAYLAVRMLVAGLRGGPRSSSLMPVTSVRWLMAGIGLLVVARVALNVAGSSLLDVGAAGVVGAGQLIHGHPVYGGQLAGLVPGGDTYGPANYLAYVPFRAALGGGVTNLPAAHAAAIVFDLLTAAGLYALGRRLRAGAQGQMLGLALTYGWLAYPYSTFALLENTNDALVAALLVGTLLVLAFPMRRGVLLALAAMVKFFPLALIPLIATGHGPRKPRSWILFAVGFVVAGAVCMAAVVRPGELHAFYDATLRAQFQRTSPLSIWGQFPSLSLLRTLLEVATVVFACVMAFLPRARSRSQVAALAAVVVIALQCCLEYWYYPYVAWFAPLVLVALMSEYRISGGDDLAPPRPRAVHAGLEHPEALELVG